MTKDIRGTSGGISAQLRRGMYYPARKCELQVGSTTVLGNGKGVVIQVGLELVEVSMILHFWIWDA